MDKLTQSSMAAKNANLHPKEVWDKVYINNVGKQVWMRRKIKIWNKNDS